MLLPNAERAEIDAAKLRGYLLSPTHPIGRFKARFFAALGYSADEWQTLEADLRIQHLSQDAEPGTVTPYGQPYTIRAILKGPNGESAFVASIWFALAGFALMLASGLVIYHHLRRMGKDQLRSHGERGGHLSVTAALARLAERFRRPRGSN